MPSLSARVTVIFAASSIIPGYALRPANGQPATLDPNTSHAFDGGVATDPQLAAGEPPPATVGTAALSRGNVSVDDASSDASFPGRFPWGYKVHHSVAMYDAAARIPWGYKVHHSFSMYDAVARIEHVQPPSGSGVILATWIVAALAVCVFIFELAFPQQSWSDSFARLRSLRDSPQGGDAAVESKHMTDVEQKDAPPAPPSDLYERRWTFLIFSCIAIAAADLYYNMPGTFIVGEVQSMGIDTGIAGLYIGLAGFLAMPTILLVPWLSQFLALTDLVRIGSAIFVFIATVQGFANQLNRTGFLVLLMVSRFLEGLPLGLIETAGAVLTNKAFPLDEIGGAMAILMTLRGSIITASAPVGGLLYKTGGFSLPFTVIGGLGIAAIPVLRCLITKPPVTPDKPASIFVVFKVPGAMAIFFSYFSGIYILSAMDCIWQPWLGTAPYGWDPAQIATVGMTLGIFNLIAVPVIGVPFNAVMGDLVSVTLGATLSLVGPFFIGNPPIFFPWLTDPPAWLPYVALGVGGLGSAIAAPPMYSLPIRVMIEGTGLTQEQIAAPVGVLSAFLPYVGYSLGPLISGQIVQAVGVSGAALTNLCLGAFSQYLVIIMNWNVLVRKPETASKAAPASAIAAASKGD